jgi:hypothetical protein
VLGFAPLESFVFLTMRNKALGATLRVDAPVTGAPVAFARAMVDYLAVATQATSVLLAVYTDTPAGGAPRPFHDYVEAVIQESRQRKPQSRTRGSSPPSIGGTCCATARQGAACPNRWNLSRTGS